MRRHHPFRVISQIGLPGACGRGRSRATSESPTIPPAGSGSDGAYLAVKGVRDIASGLFVFILMASLATHVLGGPMQAATTIPVMVWVIVLTHHDPKATAYGVHRATAVLMLATAGVTCLTTARPITRCS